METMEVQHILIEILYAAINGIENDESIKEKLTPEMLPSVYRLAKKHDLAHVVSHFVYRSKMEIDPELRARLHQEELLSVYRNEQMKYALGEICRIFDEAEITYIPLKGSVIRPFYPYESMRTSCDVDILIHEEDLKAAINSLEAKGYQCGKRNYHDVPLFAPNKVHLELHFNIQENMADLDVVLKDAWQYAVPTNGSQYAFSKEFFAFHIFAHMAYHFVSGGCGIRSLLDIWVLEHKMGISYTCAKPLLEKAGIYQFASEMSKLAERCFTQNSRDPFSDFLLKYIFSGGVYGSVENHVAVDKSKSGGSVGYVFKRLFLPYSSMMFLFPCLKKAPYLLPFCWVIRWINVILGGKSKRIISEMTYVSNLSDEKLQEITAIRSRLGL